MNSHSYSKLDRATDLYNHYKIAEAEYLLQNPPTLICQLVDSGDEVEIKTGIKENIPAELSTILGDVIHNMRSSLDAALYACLNKTAIKKESIQFPFVRQKHKLSEELTRRQITSNKVLTEIIRRWEPYEHGRFGLYQLHKLDVLDKHHGIPLIVAATTFSGKILQRFTGPSILIDGPVTIFDRAPFFVNVPHDVPIEKLLVGVPLEQIGVFAEVSPSILMWADNVIRPIDISSFVDPLLTVVYEICKEIDQLEERGNS